MEQNQRAANAPDLNALDKGQPDLGVSRLREPDLNWRAKPIQMTASQERLDKPHQRVSIRNTHPLQTHIVIDRVMQGHEILPGQIKHDIDMLADDIDYFLRMRQPRTDNLGRQLPLHPIVIEGIPQEPRNQNRS
jgi:hypothetical protein